MVTLDGDLQSMLWTTREAAAAAGVKPGVIRIWVHRGHLKRANPEDERIALYRAIDVIKAEKATREKARRTYPAAA